jgi:poly-gamma-glutamate capsule biosynthesis protein CapA/YwtB (metallophosphatase superfamily)
MLKIVVTGDFCPIYNIVETSNKNAYKDIFGDFPDAIKGKDILITNLECPFTNSMEKIPKDGPILKATPEMFEAVKYANVDVACLANNHILDSGEQGLLDTIDLCKKNGINTVGAGKNLSEASEILYLSVRGKKIAIINITQHEFSIASNDRAGANPLNLIQNYYSITEAKKHSSIVLVIVHGGNEEYPLPSKRIVDTYRFFADIGASAIISHHAHCISGYEIYNEIPIFYGLGNFIFDKAAALAPDTWFTGLMLLLNISDADQITFELKPFYQSKNGVGFKVLEGSDKMAVMKEIDLYTEIIKDEKKLQQKWNDFLEKSRHYYYTSLGGLGFIRRKLFRFPFMRKWIFPIKRKTVLYDLIKCEAHNDVVSDLLMKDLIKK